MEGIRVRDEIVNNIRYADDTAFLAESMEDFQSLMDAVNDACIRYGLTINTIKIKLMIVSRVRFQLNLKSEERTLNR